MPLSMPWSRRRNPVKEARELVDVIEKDIKDRSDTRTLTQKYMPNVSMPSMSRFIPSWFKSNDVSTTISPELNKAVETAKGLETQVDNSETHTELKELEGKINRYEQLIVELLKQQNEDKELILKALNKLLDEPMSTQSGGKLQRHKNYKV